MLSRSFGYLNILRMAGIGFLLMLLTASGMRAQTPACTLKNNEREWIERTLGLWQTVSHDSLRLKAVPLPWMVFFDETCVWHVNPNLSVSLPKLRDSSVKTKLSVSGKFVDVYGFVHEGNITLPDKKQIPPQLISFAATYDNGKKSFFVFSMPAIWRQAEHLKTETNLDALIRSVFVHEMTHTRHRNFFGKLDRIEKQHSFSETFDDDIIQSHFDENAGFRKAYQMEHDLLFQAVGETNLERKRELAAKVLDLIRSRRKQFFTGTDEFYAEIEEIFLTMEGVANWAAYKSARVQGLNESDAVKLMRRSGRRWSQDEGLGLFLVIDALLPNWQKETFGKSLTTVLELLNKAVNRKETYKKQS